MAAACCGGERNRTMKCPNCGRDNSNAASRCVSCGSKLTGTEQITANGLKAVTAGGAVFGKKAREARISEITDPGLIISDRAYNGIIGGVLLWGLLINYFLCLKVGSFYNLFPDMNPTLFLVCYIVLVIIGMIMAFKAESPLISFAGYNLVVIPFGIVIATIVEAYGGISSTAVTQAFLYTLLVTVAITATVIVFPKAFERIGSALGIALGALILCEILMLLFGVRQQWTSWIAAGLFSMYLGYDIYRSQMYPRTIKNAVASALDIYMDLANLFIRILEIIGKKDD